MGHEKKTCSFPAAAKKADGKGGYVRLYGNWVRADLYSWLWWPEERKIAPPVEPQPSPEDIAQRIARGDRHGFMTQLKDVAEPTTRVGPQPNSSLEISDATGNMAADDMEQLQNRRAQQRAMSRDPCNTLVWPEPRQLEVFGGWLGRVDLTL
ncbi:hypothetical protein TIFTF001_012289 [Ficus carica]|uniref:Uncharacterized protein n=1 Tax=Ficus carica TaxID=3494 RepID=A0AA87ZYR4_FICCA|nr:hypothetical protein TIFTF001_012289 [Ficus carica]